MSVSEDPDSQQQLVGRAELSSASELSNSSD